MFGRDIAVSIRSRNRQAPYASARTNANNLSLTHRCAAS